MSSPSSVIVPAVAGVRGQLGQPVQRPQQRRLAAAGWPDQRQHLALVDRERRPPDGRHAVVEDADVARARMRSGPVSALTRAEGGAVIGASAVAAGASKSSGLIDIVSFSRTLPPQAQGRKRPAPALARAHRLSRPAPAGRGGADSRDAPDDRVQREDDQHAARTPRRRPSAARCPRRPASCRRCSSVSVEPVPRRKPSSGTPFCGLFWSVAPSSSDDDRGVADDPAHAERRAGGDVGAQARQQHAADRRDPRLAERVGGLALLARDRAQPVARRRVGRAAARAATS